MAGKKTLSSVYITTKHNIHQLIYAPQIIAVSLIPTLIYTPAKLSPITLIIRDLDQKKLLTNV